MRKFLLTIFTIFLLGASCTVDTSSNQELGLSSVNSPTLWKYASNRLSPVLDAWKVNTSTISGVFGVENGGIATSTSPSEGDLLIGNSSGTYNFVSSSSLPFVATESDPIYSASQAFNIDATDITNLGNLSGTNTGDQSSSDFDHGGLTGLADDDHTQYALLAGRSGGQTLIGSTVADQALYLQANSASSGNTNAVEAFGLKVGNSGATKAITVNQFGQVGIKLAGTTFQSTNPILEVNGAVEARNRIIVGRNYQAGGATGSQPLVTLWWSGERTMLGFNFTTGKLQYIGPGGTQGFEFLTLNRSADFNQLSTDVNYGLTLNTTDPNSAGQHHVAVNTRFNGLGTYDAMNIKLFDSASNANSTYLNLYSSATYQGTQTSVWKIRKDGTTITTSDVYITTSTKGIVLTSPDGTCARGTIDNSDVLTFASITCP